MEIKELLTLAVQNKTSDLHIIAGILPMVRINGELQPLANAGVLDPAETERLILSVLNEEQKKKFLANKELDFSYSLANGSRFRVNAYYTGSTVAASFRTIISEIPTLEELNLPEILHQFVPLKQGFILVTAPTGHGKSTTVASILQEANKTRRDHIVTIEDPIEYLIKPEKSIISQREIGTDSLSFTNALRSCLREDPNIVFLGEMRDLETISLALTIAETGHLVFSTLHTNSAAQSVDRIIDVFPEDSKRQVALQLANVLVAIVSQRLVPTVDNFRVPAVEVLVANTAVKTAIREGKTHMIDNIIQTSADAGMVFLEKSLASWVKQGRVDLETARLFALRPKELTRLLRDQR